LDRKHSDKILLKEDGSLDNGFEMVTGKLGLEYHQKLWPSILATARSAGARSWKHSTTGLHVHLSRNWFSPLTLGKFLVFINSPKTRPYVLKLAARETPSFAALKAKKLTERPFNSNRYEAVNLSNSETIEVRIFKGTLNETHVLADIEFCHALALFCADCSVAEAEQWDSFRRWLEPRKAGYKALTAFLNQTTNTAEER
jgi:hypothetical protein